MSTRAQLYYMRMNSKFTSGRFEASLAPPAPEKRRVTSSRPVPFNINTISSLTIEKHCYCIIYTNLRLYS